MTISSDLTNTIKMNRSFPQPPKAGSPSKVEFKDDDLMFILKTKLRPEHYEDARVVSFICHYMSTKDLKHAAQLAGLTARSARNLRNRKDVHEALAAIGARMALKYDLDADEIVETVKNVAFLDPADFVDENGVAIQNLKDMPMEARRALKKFKVKNLYHTDPNGMKVLEGHLVEFEFWDKLKASEFLGREKGLFKETTVMEHDITKDMKNVLLEAKQRADERLEESRKLGGGREVLEIEASYKDEGDGKDS